MWAEHTIMTLQCKMLLNVVSGCRPDILRTVSKNRTSLPNPHPTGLHSDRRHSYSVFHWCRQKIAQARFKVGPCPGLASTFGRKIDWVTFSERIVAQSCDFILDSWDYWQPMKFLKERFDVSCLRALNTSLAAELWTFLEFVKKMFWRTW